MSASLTLLAGVLLYGVWRIVRAYFVPSTLDNVPGPRPASVLAGSAAQLFAHDNAGFLQSLIDTYGPVTKLQSFLGAKWLHVYDPKALHSILVKDAELYSKSDSSRAALNLLLGPGVLATVGETHKRQRKLLIPAFSTAHLRDMTPLFHEITRKLKSAIESRVATGAKELDIQGWMSRTGLELVGQGLLDHSFDPLTEETSDEFTNAVKALVPSFVEISWTRMFLPIVQNLGPAWFRRKLLDALPIRKVQRVKDISDAIQRHSLEIYNKRKMEVQRGEEATVDGATIGNGKDLMSALLKANLEANEEDKLPDEELLAQMSIFIFAGVDTTSNAMARVLHLLALHPDVQEKLCTELVEAHVRYGDNMPYNELSQLPYLDAVCRETMRLYSPTILAARESVENTLLPVTEPIRGIDGKLITEVAVPKGTFIMLNLRACNSNKALWGEDAREWKPERWLAPLPREIEEARIPGIYSNLVTFGAGGNSCIGFKFSQLEMKVVLYTMVRSFKYNLPEKPILWNFGGVEYPTMGGPNTVKAEMYMKVERVQE